MLLTRLIFLSQLLVASLFTGSALANTPFGVGIAEQRSPGFLPWVGRMQQEFYQSLTQSLSALSESGTAVWWLAGLSFLYGVVHAIGPGHGKVVISSYLLANKETVRRGIGIAFLAAMVQASVAVLLVSIVAIALNMTSVAMTQTARVFEIGSYVLITALGLFLLGRKIRALMGTTHRHAPASLSAAATTEPLSPISEADSHDHACCHHHVDPEALADKKGFGGALAAVLSVGMRPCSGALIVLVFALSQGIYWAGILSAYVMGLGTALSVAALASMAVGAKGLALKFAGADGRTGQIVMNSLEIVAALFITLFGLVLLGGALSI